MACSFESSLALDERRTLRPPLIYCNLSVKESDKEGGTYRQLTLPLLSITSCCVRGILYLRCEGTNGENGETRNAHTIDLPYKTEIK